MSLFTFVYLVIWGILLFVWSILFVDFLRKD
jgi:hypothetical protein